MWFLGSYKCKLCVWTSGLKHLDQGCQTRGLCSPSGPFEADSLGPSVKVKNGSKKLTGVFVFVTLLAGAGRTCSRGEARHDITATLSH